MAELRNDLEKIDGRAYGFYKDLRGRLYTLGAYDLTFEHIQGDPFAAPSRIRAGVTLIAGGGYHGKSTSLAALANGVYDHIPGDGRDRCVTVASAVSIRAEDGRSVRGVDLRPFIKTLPLGRRTDWFDTDDASGSTSQAAALNRLRSLRLVPPRKARGCMSLPCPNLSRHQTLTRRE